MNSTAGGLTVPLILASTSPIRAALLRGARVPFETESPGVDESACTEPDPAGRAAALAEAKALAVARRRPGRLVLGSDQVLSLDGRHVPKCATDADVALRLRELSGRAHRFDTAFALARDGRIVARGATRSEVEFHALEEQEIEAAVSAGEGRGSAGGYELEAGGARFVRGLRGDVFSVLGLPLIEVLSALRALRAL